MQPISAWLLFPQMLHTCSLREEEAKLIAWLVYEMMNDCPDDSADVNIYFIFWYGYHQRENTGSRLFTEVKPCLTGLISGWVTI